MTISVKIRGTLPELEELWPWNVLCDMVCVDYYKRNMVPDTEVFEITEESLIQARIITRTPT